jgi:hypothetical protein
MDEILKKLPFEITMPVGIVTNIDDCMILVLANNDKNIRKILLCRSNYVSDIRLFGEVWKINRFIGNTCVCIINKKTTIKAAFSLELQWIKSQK